MKELRNKAALVLLSLLLPLAGCAKKQLLDLVSADLALLDHVEQAARQEDQGDLRGAIRTYKKALDLNKNSPLLHLYIAQAYYDLGNDTLASLYAKRALRLDSLNADPRLIIGNSLLLSRDWKPASDQYRKALELDPGNSDIAVTLSGLYEILDLQDSAVAVLERTWQSNGDQELELQLAATLARARKYTEATERYRSILQGEPANTRAASALAGLFEAVEQPDSALRYYQLAEQAAPENRMLKRHSFNLYLHLNDYPAAIDKARQMLELAPDDRNIRLQLARLYYQQDDRRNALEQFLLLSQKDSTSTEALYTVARLKLEQKQYAEAAGYFRRTLKLLPRLSEGWLNLGICQLALGQTDSAVAYFKKSRRHGNRMRLDYIMGYAYAQLEQYSQAIPHYLKIYPKYKKDPSFLFNVAVAYERSGQFDRAVEYFRKVLALQPGNHAALNYLGYMYAERGINLDEAGEMISKALKAQPDNPYYIDSMGWVYFKLGNLSGALAELDRAVQFMPDDATLREHLGDIYYALAQKDKALEQWQKALELDPKKEEVKKKIETNE
jgi:tetratricopeptide (TPR) repeat protein